MTEDSGWDVYISRHECNVNIATCEAISAMEASEHLKEHQAMPGVTIVQCLRLEIWYTVQRLNEHCLLHLPSSCSCKRGWSSRFHPKVSALMTASHWEEREAERLWRISTSLSGGLYCASPTYARSASLNWYRIILNTISHPIQYLGISSPIFYHWLLSMFFSVKDS